jgi:hypothetical protein
MKKNPLDWRVCSGHDHRVVGFTTTCAISAYHHYSCEFKPHSWWGVLDTTLCDNIKFVSNLRYVGGFLQDSGFLHQWNWLPRYNWIIVESGINHHKPTLYEKCFYICFSLKPQKIFHRLNNNKFICKLHRLGSSRLKTDM